ncbi:MAG: glutamine--fructose-6-phosphate transaminase (isomerizing) [Chromatiales bacterium]|nr:glutamine--fructose-6-phosphate transaminase (isomerizing) [Chromatiales bacterium]PLX56291.1 MAG: glutamine--fructose-6-phosphate transaminase (isomerizing) [Chromatiales bacterium]
MCGIVGAVAERNVIPVLMEGLRRLEYRGYDSAGLAALDEAGKLDRRRTLGKVAILQAALDSAPVIGHCGIAHTRWATHGEPSERNAHPHLSLGGDLAIVHNGIIENHEPLRAALIDDGYVFESETDTEVIAHRIHYHLARGCEFVDAVRKTVAELEGAYALAVLSEKNSDELVIARAGAPAVIGVGIGENFVASDVSALLPVTRRFIFLEEGDIAHVRRAGVTIYDASGETVERPVRESELAADAVERGEFRHYMLKEIYEQPVAIANTLEERIAGGRVLSAVLGPRADILLDKVEAVHIVACGTSFHAGLVARYVIEEMCGIPCRVEIASEYRYRSPVVGRNTLFVTISQSGETADTLAALRRAQTLGYLGTLSVCNVPESSLVRESDLALMTRAGPEIGVASTKAFTTQLAALSMLTLLLARHHGMAEERERELTRQLEAVPGLVERALASNDAIRELAEDFADKEHALFLGRGIHYPIALEGALKLKEISYIHAEAYAAGELKHGPLALVDADMPIIAVAPNDQLLEKLKSNLQEVKARGGQLYVFADPNVNIGDENGTRVLAMPDSVEAFQSPIIYTLPLQLLAYHVAVLKGTDVDQPRNLAKSVTVE